MFYTRCCTVAEAYFAKGLRKHIGLHGPHWALKCPIGPTGPLGCHGHSLSLVGALKSLGHPCGAFKAKRLVHKQREVQDRADADRERAERS